MKDRRRTLSRVAFAVVGIATLVIAVYIMSHGMGLQDELNFGAGSYYYADIPDFDKYLKWDAFTASLPYWVYVALFLLWGALMYLLWIWVDNSENMFRKIQKWAGWLYFLPLAVCCRNCPESEGCVEVNGVSLFYTVRGPEGGKPVVLMHGNGGSHKSVATQQMQLAREGYRVYCPDSRGQGANEPLTEYHYADMAEDCYCFIRALGLEKPFVAGWSDGGINALLLEMAHPGTCCAIAAAGANLYPDCGEGFEEFKEWILSEGTPLALMMLSEPQIDPADLAAIKCPALITAGSKDIISVEHTELIASSIPGSTLRIFKGATHSSYIKRNPRWGKCMIEWLRGVE